MRGRAIFSAVITLLSLTVRPVFAQSPAVSPDGAWQTIAAERLPAAQRRPDLVGPHTFVQLDRAALDARLAQAPLETAQNRDAAVVLTLPLPDGRFTRFRIEESPILAPELAAAFPSFRTYRGVGLDDPTASARIDLTLTGLHAQVLAAGGTLLVDPVAPGDVDRYVAFSKSSQSRSGDGWNDEVLDVDAGDAGTSQRSYNQFPLTHGTSLRTYRLALAVTGEYTTLAGGTKPLALSRLTTTMNRVNGILEREIAVRLTVATGSVADPTALLFTDGLTDPYTNGTPSSMIGQNQTTLDTVVGTANYDMGHVFGTGGGGIAYLQAVCNSALKAQGATGLPNPTGDTFAVDYVSHEMGHQFGANHSYNSSSGSCTSNRSTAHAFEVGSGATIMSYSGLCSPENTTFDSLDRYDIESLNEMTAFLTAGGGTTCGVSSATGNVVPGITLGGTSFSIPGQTPFALTATATDGNGDALTYAWEQHDKNNLSTANPWGNDDGVSALFRSYAPVSTGTRYFPSLPYILNNANLPPSTYACSGGTCIVGERLPTTTRSMTFMLTVRDNHAGGGGLATATTTVAVNASIGPFAVVAPQGGETWPASSLQTVQWSVNGTNTLTPSVAILLSTDGGNTFPVTLVANTPNDGAEAVQLPATQGAAVRIKVQAVGNIFFDISNANFTLSAPLPPPGPFTKTTPTNGATGRPTSLSLTWTSSSTATDYEYCLDTSNNATCDSSWVQTASLSSQVVAGLAPATTYSWQVRSRSAAGATEGDSGTWFTFTTATVTNPLADVVIDFGAAYGLWTYYDQGGSPVWQQLHAQSPTRIATGDIDGNGQSDVFAVFAGYGLFVYLNNSTWTQLHGFEPTAMASGDVNGNGKDDLVVSFPGAGVYILFDSGTWQQLTYQTANIIAVGNIDGAGGPADVVISSSTGTAVWRNNTQWTQIHPLPAQSIQIGDVDGNGINDLVLQFAGYGEWLRLNETSWVQLHGVAASTMVVANIDGDSRADVIVSFPGYGVWAWKNNTSWAQLHPLNPTVLAAGDVDGNGQTDLIMDFPGYGIFVLRNSVTWTQVHVTSSEAIVTGRLNSN